MQLIATTFAFLALLLGGSQVEASESPPVLPVFSPALKEQFGKDLAKANRTGMRSRVFAKVGDSNIASFNVIYGLGCRPVNLDGRKQLRKVLRRYRAVRLPAGYPVPWGFPTAGECRPSNSFSRYSAAGRSGAYTSLLTNPVSKISQTVVNWTPDPSCDPAESMVYCEIKAIRPRYSLISIGTNDETFWYGTGDAAIERITKVVDQVRTLGSVPVLFTLPPHIDNPEAPGDSWQYAVEMNEAIAAVARAEKVPLLNVWRALVQPQMSQYGLGPDGLHLETAGGWRSTGALARSVDFRPRALAFGNNRRNLLLLRTLAILDRQAAALRRR